MSVKEIRNEHHFQMEQVSHGRRLIIINFTDSNSMQYRRITYFFQRMASKFSKAVLLNVDMNKCQETMSVHGIYVMPTCLFFKNRRMILKLEGYEPAALEIFIEKYYKPDEDHEDSGIPGQIDLITFVLKTDCIAWNESDEHPFMDCLSLGEGYLESDVDEQMILSMTFTQAVKINSIRIKAPFDNGPKKLRLFINQPYVLDFDTAINNNPVQELIISKDDLKGKPINLSCVKFQTVRNIYVFVKDNQSDKKTTQINYFQVIGLPVKTTIMKDFKRVNDTIMPSSLVKKI